MAFTVKELIEELQCYEEDKIVWIKLNGQYRKVEGVEIEGLISDDDIVIS